MVILDTIQEVEGEAEEECHVEEAQLVEEITETREKEVKQAKEELGTGI